jgi:hypothetical protein
MAAVIGTIAMHCTILTTGTANGTICPVAPKAIRRLVALGLKVRK